MKLALLILDGWGIADHDRLNAVEEAKTPNFDHYADIGGYTTLRAAGRDVGLPSGQASNSEVGHLNIGSGRIVKQAYTRVNESIETGDIRDNPAIRRVFEETNRQDGTLHFMGLVSDGGVHSDMKHLFALIEIASEFGLDAVTHVFTDGRDAPPRAGIDHVRALKDVVEEQDNGYPATVMGRYYAMDRNENWDRTKQAYDAIVKQEAEWTVPSAIDAIKAAYNRSETDEFIKPTLIEEGGPVPGDGDGVFVFNFRPDRSRQLVRMLGDIDPQWGFETSPPDLTIGTLTQYDESFDVQVAFEPPTIDRTLGEEIENAGLTQFRIAESEKQAHVTYFFNGGRELRFENEIRKIVPSPDVETYEETPEMSAYSLTDTAVDTIEQDNPDLMILNYSNPDMVGHTGNFDAAVKAVEVVDDCIGRLVDVCRGSGATVLLTSDHGTADDMGTLENPDTAHTPNPVPLIYVPPAGKKRPNSKQEGTNDRQPATGPVCLREDGVLADISPTILTALNLDKPAEMTGDSLLVSDL